MKTEEKGKKKKERKVRKNKEKEKKRETGERKTINGVSCNRAQDVCIHSVFANKSGKYASS